MLHTWIVSSSSSEESWNSELEVYLLLVANLSVYICVTVLIWIQTFTNLLSVHCNIVHCISPNLGNGYFRLWYYHLFSLITCESKGQIAQKEKNLKTVPFLQQILCDQTGMPHSAAPWPLPPDNHREQPVLNISVPGDINRCLTVGFRAQDESYLFYTLLYSSPPAVNSLWPPALSLNVPIGVY